MPSFPTMWLAQALVPCIGFIEPLLIPLQVKLPVDNIAALIHFFPVPNCCYVSPVGGHGSPEVAGLLIIGSLVRTHSGACLIINYTSLSPAIAWPSLA